MLLCLGAIIGIFSQINAGDDDSREHAVNFLKQNVLAMIPKVFDPNPDAAEALTEEIRKVCCLLQYIHTNYILCIQMYENVWKLCMLCEI